MTLLLGTVLSLLAFLTLFFAMRVARSNRALQREIAVREGVENELRRARDELGTRVHERTAELATANVLLQKEVTEHERAEDALRELTGRLFRMQDEERRRLARELHDGTTQNLVALTMDVARLRDAIPAEDTSTQELGRGCVRLARECTEELRTLSYLLHPPLLNELGLTSALQDFTEGFANRTGIDIAVNIDPELGRFDQQLEVTVFRIVQEALSNIHRHAHSRTAAITLMRHADCLHLEVADAGRGIPPEVLAKEGSKMAGVGIAGIRERVRLLGGTLDIQSGTRGTIIQVVLPVSFLSVRKAVTKADRASAGRAGAVA
jgi:signal transduction histidine kinase